MYQLKYKYMLNVLKNPKKNVVVTFHYWNNFGTLTLFILAQLASVKCVSALNIEVGGWYYSVYSIIVEAFLDPL